MLTEDLRTPRLVLSCLRVEHATEKYRSWMSDEDVIRYLESRSGDSTIESLQAYISSVRDSSDSLLFGMFDPQDGSHYGNIKLGPISAVHGSAAIGLIIGDKDAWGRDYASEAIGALSDWALSSLRLDKLWAGAYRRNAGSIRAFEKNGYEIEGVQRSQVRLADGSRDDVVLLGRASAWSDGPS